MISELKIVTGLRAGATWLKESYWTRPFKLADIGAYRTDKALCLMLMSASPGMLDGDDYRIHITVSAGSRLQLQTQAYQRLYHMEHGACQHMQVEVHQGASFSYIPHPVVPHAGASFEGHNRIFLEAGSRLIWGEIVTCGRKLCGEVFQFRLFHNITELYYQGKLIVKDNLLLQPERIKLAGPGQLEGFTHQATLIYADTRADAPPMADVLLDLLAGEEEIAYGVSQAAGPAIVLRILGNGAEQLFGCMRRMEKVLWQERVITDAMTN
ncbi:urease accessory protein UreD [Chitinophaga agrisoli]|uniref:Urease accessory protein UreD n=1 Tax=Chitinophaga agrisoli TaxID=2607653 RepID=A0A5B2VIV5_9BACT|nr:urease accessory protein UreD [Chitinophaga agrisoli]KAA2238588.1 urease accessory protein UreD [Chitinophaga agrisoli]